MPARWIATLRVLAHAACAVPLAYLLWHLVQSLTTNPNALGPDPTATVTFFTGFGALRLLVITLAITPIRRIFTQVSWLVRFRRLLGLWAFAYACLHLLTYLWLYAGWSWPVITADITQRPYIIVGFTAWVLMLPLAVTSTTWAIRKLGGKRWAWLHRLIYLSAIAGVVHYWWIVKTGVRTPWTITLILGFLLLLRPLLAWWKRRPVAAQAA